MYKPTSIEILHWDSDFFGYPVGKYVFEQADALTSHIPALMDEARQKQIRLLYVYTPVQSGIIEPMQASGGLWTDHKVHLVCPLQGQASPATTGAACSISQYTLPHATTRLEALALLSGAHSRFRLDPHFRNQEFERLYRHWIARCLKSSDTSVWIAGTPQHPTALLALRSTPPTAYIELIAVDLPERGKGVGRCLMQHAAHRARQAGCRFLRLNTQYHNRQAIQFYEKAGFQIEKQNYVFHFWF
ncbi:MAG: hypothetical protein KatS3mg033_0222 [Thermonema sp.]|uniref:GNAT family N-acetyltransferase n=1 Tax=Thermonema sp. TaxID=2231181 RepID=UPI0021DBF004|nr:GNAT family N-acetyltransferase [Thermonema sp.]GIV38422.1 MAG: hypothetical protein KatS3mg033_0222 [Thermonema sp.]